MEEPQLFPNRPNPDQHLKKQAPQQEAFANVSKSVTALGSRLRILEEQYSNVRNKSQLTEQNLLDFERDVRSELKSLSEDVLEIKSVLQEIKEKIDVVGSELDNTVKEHDLKVVEKYVDLWNPTKFVTKEALRESLEEIKKKV